MFAGFGVAVSLEPKTLVPVNWVVQSNPKMEDSPKFEMDMKQVALTGPELFGFFSDFVLIISCSVHFPCYFQHFGAGSCHFNGICNMFETRVHGGLVFGVGLWFLGFGFRFLQCWF